jgi:hypothetical protein
LFTRTLRSFYFKIDGLYYQTVQYKCAINYPINLLMSVNFVIGKSTVNEPDTI